MSVAFLETNTFKKINVSKQKKEDGPEEKNEDEKNTESKFKTESEKVSKQRTFLSLKIHNLRWMLPPIDSTAPAGPTFQFSSSTSNKT